jgi:LacI family transcriptional regulator
MTLESVRRAAPTLEQVAAAAGVSRSTASRVLNGSPQVSEAVVAAVHAAIAELHYVPNRAARSLVNRQTLAIALVVPEDTTRFFGDPYFASIVQGISSALEESDYVLNLTLASAAGPTSKTMRYLLGGNVDGALVVSHHRDDRILAALGEALPLVFGGRPLNPDESSAYYVDVDNVAAAEQGVQYLIDSGRTRIATIAGPADMPAGIDRLEGWRRAVERAGLDSSLAVHGGFTRSGGMAATRELLQAYPDIDAIFAASDLMASGAISVLGDRSIDVPGRVAVMGFDDSPAAVDSEIALTTVRQPSVEMGKTMARMLLQLLRGESVERRCIMETSIVPRASA